MGPIAPLTHRDRVGHAFLILGMSFGGIMGSPALPRSFGAKDIVLPGSDGAGR